MSLGVGVSPFLRDCLIAFSCTNSFVAKCTSIADAEQRSNSTDDSAFEKVQKDMISL